MGVDIFGKNPTSQEGEYFRSNWWYWRPIAEYLTTTFPEQTAPCQYWHSNDGDGLDADQSQALAGVLGAELDNGNAQAWGNDWEQRRSSLAAVACDRCAGTGRQGHNQPCRACQGSGQQPDPDTHYPFDLEHLKNFHAFLTHCGGFTIR